MAFAFDSADGLGGKNELPMMPQKLSLHMLPSEVGALHGIVIQLQPPSSQHKNNPLALASIRLSKSLVGSTYQCKTNLFR
eukprot:scaffold3357_cov127-Skeletonema_marinoi.AAC.2